jgi:hypothetical protein
LAQFGILIQVPAPQDAIVSGQRNKIKRADFFNRISNKAAVKSMYERTSGSGDCARKSGLSATSNKAAVSYLGKSTKISQCFECPSLVSVGHHFSVHR